MAVKEKLRKAVFIKDHVFMYKGKRSVSAKQQKDKKMEIWIPQNYWDSFAVNKIVKATDKQIEAAQKRIDKKKAAVNDKDKKLTQDKS